MSISTSEQVNEIFAALSKAQAVMQTAKRTSENPFFKSKYAELSEIWDVAREPLTTNGLSVMQGAECDDIGVVVTCRICHNSGQWAESSLRMKPTKNDPQGVGSAITYARRYLLSAMVGVSIEDDDGNEASQPPQKKESATANLITEIQKLQQSRLLDEKQNAWIEKELSSGMTKERAEKVIEKLKALPVKLVYGEPKHPPDGE